MSELKEKLHQLCVAYVQTRISAAEQAIVEAQQAQFDDTKSSAGDKYETGREMAQQEKNRHTAQLNETNKLLIALNHIPVNGSSKTVENGSIIYTSNGNFYLSVSAGSIASHGESFFAVSPSSPIGVKLKGLQAGDEFILNGKNYQILRID